MAFQAGNDEIFTQRIWGYPTDRASLICLFVLNPATALRWQVFGFDTGTLWFWALPLEIQQVPKGIGHRNLRSQAAWRKAKVSICSQSHATILWVSCIYRVRFHLCISCISHIKFRHRPKNDGFGTGSAVLDPLHTARKNYAWERWFRPPKWTTTNWQVGSIGGRSTSIVAWCFKWFLTAMTRIYDGYIYDWICL